jgi:ectoine hydroxylase-related dioxygenase (phytanoyl-CoA dioxygenase family)
VQVNQIQARTVPWEAASSYTSWHRDAGDKIPIDPEYSTTLKAFTFFFDCGPEQGCAAVLPGSHRVQFACNPHWGHDKDQETMGSDGMPNSERPAFVKFPCKAGTVVMYDNRIFHNALPNTTKEDRCALITSYQPYGRSQSGQVVSNAGRLLAAGAPSQLEKPSLLIPRNSPKSARPK